MAPASAWADEDDEQDESHQSGFTLTGEPVSGGHNAGDAVELEPGMAYVDELSEGTLYYRIPRGMDHSAMHVSIATHRDTAPEAYSWLEAQLSTWESDTCSSNSMSASGDTRDRLTSLHLAAFPDPEADPEDEPYDPCGEAGELVLTVSGAEEAELVGDPFQISIYEEPHPGNADDYELEVDHGDVEWSEMGRDISGAEAVEPGGTFAEAPQLEPGSTYEAAVRPGEVQIFRVPVDWGERLQAEAFFPEPGDTLSEQLGGMDSVSLAAFSPLGGYITGNFTSLTGRSASELRTGTVPVAWNNRYERGGRPISIAGDYYVVLVADEHDDGTDVSIPYRLTVDTIAYEAPDPPAYPEDAELDPNAALTAGADEGSGFWPFGGEDAGSADEERTGFFTPARGVLLGIGAVGLLLMAAGAVFLVRTLRSSRSQPMHY
ncbi:hypothetical protein [Nesterenkonia alba]|uniref:hypothetical protein n=1 Tax=Nesterenkonia alba TaxID=515814 RepID=UPI0003B4BB66|nr:hypothetical protein [Nesterenkonia alba]